MQYLSVYVVLHYFLPLVSVLCRPSSFFPVNVFILECFYFCCVHAFCVLPLFFSSNTITSSTHFIGMSWFILTRCSNNFNLFSSKICWIDSYSIHSCYMFDTSQLFAFLLVAVHLSVSCLTPLR